MKKITTLLILLISITITAQVYETDLTGSPNFECNVSACDDYMIGSCEGDVTSEGIPMIGEYNIYYITQNQIMEFKSLTLRNCEFQLRDGAILYLIGAAVNLETDCDDEYTTRLVPIENVLSFATRIEYENYMSTLSNQEFEIFKRKAFLSVYDMLGKKYKNTELLPKGIYIKEYSLDGRVERIKEIKN
jgi:hypothetical protein